MKKFFIGLSVACTLPFMFTGCDAERVSYDGPGYIMFSDTLSVFPVQDNGELFDVPVTALQTCDYDRTLGVEIVDKESNAIEGRHYALESNTLTIKAGERVANLKVRGFYENIGITDSLGFALRLVTDESTHWDAYGIDTKVVLKKICPFDIHNFAGPAVVTSTFINQYVPNTSLRLIRTEVAEGEENTILMKNYFYNGYDLKIKFTTNDPLNPTIKMDDQEFAETAEAFGTIYGDGEIWAYSPRIYTSYYSSCEKFIFQYMTLHVPGMEEGDVTVGTFVNAVEWISEEEYEKLKSQGF